MKKVSIKTKSVLTVFNLLNVAKLSKMEDADKMLVFFILRALKPVATAYEDLQKDATEKMKPEGFDDNIAEWNEMREKIQFGISENLPMSNSDFVDFTYKVLNPFNKSVGDITKAEAEKEVELEFEPIGKDAFIKLVNSNDFNGGQITELMELICE